jgi:hypothetical protein
MGQQGTKDKRDGMVDREINDLFQLVSPHPLIASDEGLSDLKIDQGTWH